MDKITKLVTSVLIAIPILFCLSQKASASGYHPDFFTAVKEAKIIAEGDVVETWDPQKQQLGQEQLSFREGRCYRMKVKIVFKGNVKIGDDFIFWDRHYSSTASYGINEGPNQLIYFVLGEATAFEKKNLDFKTDKEIYGPIRVVNKNEDKKWGDYYAGDIRLLDLTLINPPEDLKAAYIDILKNSTNSYLVDCAIKGWPGVVTEEDKALFKEVAQKYAEDYRIPGNVRGRLAKEGSLPGNDELIQLLKADDYRAMDMINEKNISAVQETLFECVKNVDCQNETQAIERLAKYVPDYFKDRLKTTELTIWRLIPCLQALKIDAKEIGKESIPPDVLALPRYTLFQVGGILRQTKDADFYAITAMSNLKGDEGWKTAITLLMPILDNPDSALRREVVALMRTYGANLLRQENKYVAGGDQPSTPSIKVEISPAEKVYKIKQPTKIILKEIGQKDSRWIALKGHLGWEVESKEGTAKTVGAYAMWDNTDIPKEQFIELKSGQEQVSQEDIGFLIQRPGDYRVSVIKTYVHEGSSVGLDAWTGAVQSNTIEIKVEE